MRTEVTQIRYVMGTAVEITIVDRSRLAGSEDFAVSAINDAFDEFARLERIFSTFDGESELSELNRTAGHQEFRASFDLFELLCRALEYYEASGRTFDITIGPLRDLWTRGSKEDRLPRGDEIACALERVGSHLVSLDSRQRLVRFSAEGVRLDFGGLAKGYATDRAIERLRQRGVSSALVNAGGSSIAALAGADGPPRSIGVRDPRSSDRVLGTFSITTGAISSSGGYERPLRISGRNCSHVIDPRTGWPAEGALGATVLTDSATRGEVMSKMLLILGCEEAFERFDELGWEAEGLLITDDGEGRLGVWRSPEFPVRLYSCEPA